jgi:hypothetical protein
MNLLVSLGPLEEFEITRLRLGCQKLFFKQKKVDLTSRAVVCGVFFLAPIEAPARIFVNLPKENNGPVGKASFK